MIKNDIKGVRMIDIEEAFDKNMEQLINEGYVEYKKRWLGKESFKITDKGVKYLETYMADKLRYIQ